MDPKLLTLLEAALYDALRLWLFARRARGKYARRQREAANTFAISLKTLRDQLGPEAFNAYFPQLGDELEGLLLENV